MFNPATLAGNGTTIPDAEPVYTYPTPLVSYGYTCNATGPGQLEGRPALIQQEFGEGSISVFEQDPYYRSWLPQQERAALNALIVPNGPELAATLPPAPMAESVTTEADEPIATQSLRKVKSRPAVVSYDLSNTLKISVKRGKNNRKAKVLKKAVKKSKMPKKTRKKVKWVKGKKALTLKVKNGKALDHEVLPLWVHRVEDYLARRKVATYKWEVSKEG